MKTILLGALAGALVVATGLIALPQNGEAQIRNTAMQRPAGLNDGLIALSETVDGRYQQVTVIDPLSHSMCVYHIDLTSGEIALRSVRKIHWDLQMTDFNGTKPLAGEVKTLSQQ
ncbi:MAG: hypothetical protein U9N87_10325 [Planctomycetota bacterium]|nr:hypothetical protein [Planctomycetota bacterium]